MGYIPSSRDSRDPEPRHYITSLTLHSFSTLKHVNHLLRSISRLKRRVGHAPLPARGTIRRRRPAVQVGNGRRALVLLAAGLLRRHAGLLGVHALLLRLHIGRVGVLLRGRRADGVLLGRRGGRAELLLWWVLGILRLLLLLVLGVGVLVVDGRLLLWLAGHVGRHGRLRVLLHGD